jgi:aminoglycoside phosphotransferase (APT) family kinase protein
MAAFEGRPLTKLDDPTVQQRLEPELARQIGAGRVSIVSATRLAGGAVQENWRLEAEVEGGARAGRNAWVLRTDADARIAVSLDRNAEAQVVRAAWAAGVKVAEPIAQGDSNGPLGKPFVVQARLSGSAQARRIVRDKALPDFGEALVRELAGELARIHTIRPPNEVLSCLPVPMQPPARAEVARLRSAIAKAGEPRPALEYILAWLDDHAPPAKGLALVHGDFRTGNYMVENGRLTGLLDWEFAHWGDPDEDIGWISARCWRFGNDALEVGGIAKLTPFLEAYATVAGRAVTADAVRYWQIMAAAKWAAIAVLQGDRFRIGGESSLELALTGRMPPEMEHDALTDILAWSKAGKGGPTWP